MVVRMGRLLDATLVRRASYAWVRSGSPRAFSRAQSLAQHSTFPAPLSPRESRDNYPARTVGIHALQPCSLEPYTLCNV